MHLSPCAVGGYTWPPVIRDMYDLLPPERGAELRRLNKERLAELERDGDERRARLARLLSPGPPPESRALVRVP